MFDMQRKWISILFMSFFLLIPSTTGFAFEPDMPLADVPLSVTGVDNYRYVGWSVAEAGDVDGDGESDFIVGSAGSAYLISSSSLRTPAGLSIMDVADTTFIGEDGSYNFGYVVAAAGDVNGDGLNDFLIADYRYSITGGAANVGKIYLVFGLAGGWPETVTIETAAVAAFTGEAADDYAGRGLAAAGDVNNDGFDDFIIGAYLNDSGGTNTGKVYLMLGKATGWAGESDIASAADASFVGEAAGNGAGSAVAPAGDVNADGFDDFLVGASGGAGKTYLYLGRETGWLPDSSLSNADAAFSGEQSLDGSGASVAPAGDVNGDGYDDFLIGASENDDSANRAGKAYLIFGKASGWLPNSSLSSADVAFSGENPLDHLGVSLAPAGDVNNDGFDDMLIGATWADQYAGRAYLVLGMQTGWTANSSIATADAWFTGQAPYDYAGFTMAPAGDLNRDGFDDFIVSAAYFGAYYTGKLYFIYSDAPCEGDLDGDYDVDGDDLRNLVFDLSQVHPGTFSKGFGRVDCRQ